jgi:cell wall-associated NlpC family hydrolase
MKALVPMSPGQPFGWTPEVESDARAHALEVYPKEAAGYALNAIYHRLDNVSATPEHDVELTEADLLEVANAEVFFHSHPDGLGVPTAHDMIYQAQLGIPFAILTLPDPDLFWFGDMLTPAPLLGRGFRHGVHDCFSLMRDWYRMRGVDVPDRPRDWSWWSKGQNLYLDGFEATGFQRIDPMRATQEGDVLLFNFNHPVPMHGGLVLPGNLILHHASGAKAVDPTRLSATVPRIRYQHHVTFALRRAHAA